MKNSLWTRTLIIGALLIPVGYALAEDSEGGGAAEHESNAVTYVKDSAITAKIKTKLAAEQITSMTQIKVDTDNQGVVWLSGVAKSQEEADKALSIAQGTDGVKSVKNNIKVEPK